MLIYSVLLSRLYLYFRYEEEEFSKFNYGSRTFFKKYFGTKNTQQSLRILSVTAILSLTTVLAILSLPQGNFRASLQKDAAYFFGIISSIVVSAQMLPQIVKTLKEKVSDSFKKY